MDEHHHDFDRFVGPDRRMPGLALAPIVIGLVTLVAMIAIWPRESPDVDLQYLGVTSEVYRAEVDRVIDGGCTYSSDLPCMTVVFRLLEGPTPGTRTTQEFERIPSTPDFREGESVVLNYIPEADPSFQYQFADRERRGVLVWLTAAFAAAVIILGRLRGLAALGGLALSVAVLVFFIVPAILAGTNPILVATVGATAIALVALYLAHGFGPLTHVALLGTVGSLIVTIGLATLATSLATFSGLSGEESIYLTLVGDIDVRGLLLAGIVLGALGALDDVTVTQASAVWEVRRANPDLGAAELFRSGLRVGRDHIASTVNTLLLAYAGASIPLLLLFALSQQSLGVIANSEVVAVEIVRTLVGSIGLVAAVPVTTWLAARTAARLPKEALGRGH